MSSFRKIIITHCVFLIEKIISDKGLLRLKERPFFFLWWPVVIFLFFPQGDFGLRCKDARIKAKRRLAVKAHRHWAICRLEGYAFLHFVVVDWSVCNLRPLFCGQGSVCRSFGSFGGGHALFSDTANIHNSFRAHPESVIRGITFANALSYIEFLY